MRHAGSREGSGSVTHAGSREGSGSVRHAGIRDGASGSVREREAVGEGKREEVVRRSLKVKLREKKPESVAA